MIVILKKAQFFKMIEISKKVHLFQMFYNVEKKEKQTHSITQDWSMVNNALISEHSEFLCVDTYFNSGKILIEWGNKRSQSCIGTSIKKSSQDIWIYAEFQLN